MRTRPGPPRWRRSRVMRPAPAAARRSVLPKSRPIPAGGADCTWCRRPSSWGRPAPRRCRLSPAGPRAPRRPPTPARKGPADSPVRGRPRPAPSFGVPRCRHGRQVPLEGGCRQGPTPGHTESLFSSYSRGTGRSVGVETYYSVVYVTWGVLAGNLARHSHTERRHGGANCAG